MLLWRLTMEFQPRSKNGHPAHNTTGVANTRLIQFVTCMSNRPPKPIPSSMSPIVRTKTGRPSSTATHNRRVMSTSSGFGPSSARTVRGSSAMPQIGQEPGPGLTTSGCMGQVYSTRVCGVVERSGSSAIPHFGHAPEWSCSISGSIGHTYRVPSEAVWAASGAAAAGSADFKVRVGRRLESCEAGRVAEAVRLALVVPLRGRALWIDRHPADGIDGSFGGGRHCWVLPDPSR